MEAPIGRSTPGSTESSASGRSSTPPSTTSSARSSYWSASSPAALHERHRLVVKAVVGRSRASRSGGGRKPHPRLYPCSLEQPPGVPIAGILNAGHVEEVTASDRGDVVDQWLADEPRLVGGELAHEGLLG